jgi:hypothetical protein
VSDLPPLIEFSRLQKNVLCGKVAEASLKKLVAEAVSRMRLMAKFILCLMIEVGPFFATSINYYQCGYWQSSWWCLLVIRAKQS